MRADFYRLFVQMINAPPAMEAIQVRTIPRPACRLCGSGGELLYANLTDRWFGVAGAWNLRSCANGDCGLCWLDPAPIEADLHLLYKTYFTHETKNSRQNFLAQLWNFFHGCYRVMSWAPSALLGLQKARRKSIRMFLDDLKPGKLLDVGCGNGEFLHRMHGLGWAATGLDFDLKAIENAKARHGPDLTFLNTDLASARFPDHSFDAVTMSHVIEHVSDPVALLNEARRILKAGGRLVVTTPNSQSFGHEKFRDCWSGLDAPRHLHVFSRPALEKCAREAGFNVIATSTSAAHADGFIGLSFRFQEAKAKSDASSGTRIQFNFIRGLRSLMLQYVELCQLRRDASRGEEAILICHK